RPLSWPRSPRTRSWPRRSPSSARWRRYARPPEAMSVPCPRFLAQTSASGRLSCTPVSASAAAACRRTSGRSWPVLLTWGLARHSASCARWTRLTCAGGPEPPGQLAGGDLAGLPVCVLGAAFKPGFDHVRDSPALDVALPDGRTPRGHPGCCDAESPVVPPGSTPQRRVQGVAAVDDIAPRDPAAQAARAEPGEFWPFSEQQHDMRVLS